MSGLAAPDALERAWLDLTGQLALDSQAARDAFAAIAARYAESHRAYHTLAHVGHVLHEIERLAPNAPNLRAVKLAAWFHDVVYDPRASDNEARSAAYAGKRLQVLGQPQALITEVQRLIMLTRSHEAGSDDDAGQILCDADLAILGASETRYRRYSDAIRREYAWVDEAAYRAGRIAVLQQFLQRSRIYHTATMQHEREQIARHNLDAEIQRLTGKQ